MKLLRFVIQFIWNRKLLFGVVLLMVMGSAFFFLRQLNNNPIEYTEVKKGNVRALISASGALAGKNTANLKFKTSGKLAFIDVKIGDSVTKGVLIAGLDTKDLEIDLRQAELDYLAKKAAAEKAEDDVKDHDDDESFAQKETRTKAQTSQNIAFDELKLAKLALDNAFLISPIDGIVTQASFLPGQQVISTDTIAQIVDWSQVFFDAEVDEADISRVQVGQIAEVTLNSYPDRIFPGIVTEIIPTTKTTTSGSTIVIVRIDLQNSEIHRIPGLNGQAEIIENEKQNIFIIPQETIVDDKFVFKKINGKYEKVEITTGLASDTEIEVISGLSENDQIVKNPNLVNR